jgi:hypothetical protein
MKNLFLSLVFMLFGSFAFANTSNDVENLKTQALQIETPALGDPCENCADNCCTIQWIDGNGTTRSARSCCGSIVVSPAPKKVVKKVD